MSEQEILSKLKAHIARAVVEFGLANDLDIVTDLNGGENKIRWDTGESYGPDKKEIVVKVGTPETYY